MKPEQQRIAIAEACGWRFSPHVNLPLDLATAFKTKQFAIHCWIRPGNADHQAERVPNYLADLNAMHEAEKAVILTLDGPDYYHELESIIERDRGIKLRNRLMLGFSGWLIHATAVQRAEALLKTLNLWEESE